MATPNEQLHTDLTIGGTPTPTGGPTGSPTAAPSPGPTPSTTTTAPTDLAATVVDAMRAAGVHVGDQA